MKCNHEESITKFRNEIRKDMETRWEAIRSSTKNMLDVIAKLVEVKDLDELKIMKKTAEDMKQQIQSQLDRAEMSTIERPKLMN